MTQRFRWDEENRLSDVELEGHREYRRAEYRYDLLGRRTHKLLYRHDRAEAEVITFQWNGLRLAGEAGSGAPGRKTQYVYSEGTWEPLARVDSSAAGSEIYWYHTALNGLPEQMTDAQGDTVWQGTFSTWGETQREQSHAPLVWVDPLGLYKGEGVRELGKYHVFHEHMLNPDEYTLTDKEHFSRANESVYKRLQIDSDFKRGLQTKYPGVVEHVQPMKNGKFRGSSPKGMTWHHGDSPGSLQLADFNDHRSYHKFITLTEPEGVINGVVVPLVENKEDK